MTETKLESNQSNQAPGPQSGSKPRFRIRRKFLILPEFQYRLLFWNSMSFLLVFALVLFQVSRATHEMRVMGASASFPVGHPYFLFVDRVTANLYFYVSVSFVLGGILSFLITMVVSHRLSGPVYRLMKHFESIAGGSSPGELRFRKNDYLEGYAPMINQAISRISDKLSK